MKEHEIVDLVYKAQNDNGAADMIVEKYLPFIKSETLKFSNRISVDSSDELSIAMFAFYESIMHYDKAKGSFIGFAKLAIKNRLIDFTRKEKRHKGHSYLDEDIGDGEQKLIDMIDSGDDNVSQHISHASTKEEILEFTKVLNSFGLELSDIADSCPKQDRTLTACHKALQFAKDNPDLLKELENTKKLPLSKLSSGSGVERKTLERHRKYMVAIMLAYTNGFEIIRDHIKQINPQKGGN
ncbi:MAG: RNA polymerase subunit sigma [Tissierellia bacterium]|nr:RNA polymerase subunit sigma [Tissierellia bacterium]